MTYPKTRSEYRARIMQDVCRLVSMVEADHNEHSSAEALARGLHYDVREFFDADRWRPTPVFDGICAHVPQGQPLTLCFQAYEGEEGRHVLQGRVTVIRPPGRPQDGAEFELVPRGCRKARRWWYRAGVGASVAVYAGFIEAAQRDRVQPLYHHETLQFVQHAQ
jgi:hypothetical protein